MLQNTLRWISYGLAILALAASLALLVRDAEMGTLSQFPATVISSAPLLLVGLSYLFLQPILRPRVQELGKNLLLAATFLLWGAVQLMPQNTLSVRLSNLVIVLYVLDLAWVILSSKISQQRK